ncbi:MAG TPA: PepSY domain-containing protein [Caulobacteraceae bacterium]|nr:PepSY domain-containing protein [Caulobacteraceae bacterium]
MKSLCALLATALIAVAFSGHAQQRLERGRPAMGGGGGRGFFGAPPFDGGAHGYRPGFQGYPGGHNAPPAYPQQRGGPPQGYPPYGGPFRTGAPAMGGRWRSQEDFLRQGVRQGQLAPLGRVIDNIRRVTPGRQLDAGLEYVGPRLVYRVRWMTAQGRRMDYYVDATSGAILPGR